jgi:Protein of unknown function (DUF2934)
MATKKPAAKTTVKESKAATPVRELKSAPASKRTMSPGAVQDAKAAKSPTVVQEAKSPPKPRAPRTQRPAPAGSVIAVETLIFERGRMVAEAAYYRAQRRGFSPGAELEDWLEAEAEIDRLLGR